MNKIDPETLYSLSRLAVIELRANRGLPMIGAAEELAWRLAVAHKLPLTEVCRLTGRSETDIRRDCASFSERRLGAAPDATLTEQRLVFDQFNREATLRELSA